MTYDSRDQIWNAVFETYYDTFYEEMVADALISRWQILDEITKVLVALTASGSAVAGWSLWNDPNLKYLWAFIAGTAAVLAIVHSTLLVPSRINNWSKVQHQFVNLRLDLDMLRDKMKIDSSFSIDNINNELDILRIQFRDAINNIPNDILLTEKTQLDVQEKLNIRLSDQITT